MKRELIYRKAILAILATVCFILPNANAQNMDKGLHLIEMDQFHNAIGVFKELTKQNPTNADMWYNLGLCYSEIGNADSAAIAFNAGLAADPKNPSNLAGLGVVQYLKKNDAQAKIYFADAAKLKQKKYPNGLVSILKGYAICKFPVDPFISSVYKYARENNPKDPNIFLIWGRILYTAKDYGGASAAYQNAVLNDEKNISAHYLLGQMYNAARNSQAALIELDAALALDPSYVPAIREKGDAYFALNKYDEAATWYAKYIQLTEETAASLTRYAEVLYFDKKYEKAHEIITKILKIEPNNAVMLRLMGYISYELNKDSDGVKAMNKYFQVRKDSTSNIIPKDYEYYAKLLMRSNQDSLAIIYFQKTLAVDSTNKREFIENIGELYLKEKKYIESAQYFEKTQQYRKGIDGKLQYKIGGNYLAAARLLQPADSLLKKTYLIKADSAYAKVCQSSPNAYVGYLSRARIANMLDPDGTKGLAKPFYEKTLEVAQANKPEENKAVMIESLQYLGSQIGIAFMNAAKAKDKAKTTRYKEEIIVILKKMLVLDPTNSYALENMKSLNPPARKSTGK